MHITLSLYDRPATLYSKAMILQTEIKPINSLYLIYQAILS